MIRKKRIGPSIVAKVRRTKKQAYGGLSDWYSIVKEVRKRDGNACVDCGSSEGPLHTHHIIPVSRGGKSVLFNLKTLCERCHSRKPFHGHMR